MGRGIFERRGREGFAKGAKGGAKSIKNAGIFELTLRVVNKNSLFFFINFGIFCIFFFALFAKPSRPLRSKTPRI